MHSDEIGVAERRLSLQEFQQLPEEDAHRVELTRGRLVREPRPGAEHGWLASRIFRELDVVARERDLGLVIIETGFLLTVDPPTVRGPDVAFIATASLPKGKIPVGFWRLAPDLAVEIVSPSNTAGEIQAKVLEYLESGTRLVWVVDPGNRGVTTYASRHDVHLLSEGDVLDGGEMLPGFRLRLAELFEPCSPPRP